MRKPDYAALKTPVTLLEFYDNTILKNQRNASHLPLFVVMSEVWLPVDYILGLHFIYSYSLRSRNKGCRCSEKNYKKFYLACIIKQILKELLTSIKMLNNNA